MATAHRNSQQLWLSAQNLSKIRLVKNPSTDWGLVPETPPLAEELTATGEGESTFFGVRSFVGCPYSQCMAPHQCMCEQYYGNLEGGGRGGRGEKKENKHEVGKGPWGWRGDPERFGDGEWAWIWSKCKILKGQTKNILRVKDENLIPFTVLKARTFKIEVSRW